jgi:hypothetical protein
LKNDKWVSVAEINEMLGIPVETVRRYIRCHGGHMNVEKVNNRYMIHNDSVKLIKDVSELYAGGKTLNEVEHTLSSAKADPLTTPMAPNEDESVPIQHTVSNEDESVPIQHTVSNEDESVLIQHTVSNEDESVPIQHTVSNEGESVPIQHMVSNGNESVPIHVADELKRLNGRLEQQYFEQKEFNKVLLEKLEQQERYINEKLDKRDTILVESLKLSMEERKAIVEAAVTMEKEEKDKKGFFANLFGK